MEEDNNIRLCKLKLTVYLPIRIMPFRRHAMPEKKKNNQKTNNQQKTTTTTTKILYLFGTNIF